MLRFWSFLILSAVFVLAVSPLRAQDRPPSTQEQIDALQRRITELEKSMVAVKALDGRLDVMKEELGSMRQQLKDIQESLRRLSVRESRSLTPDNPRSTLTGSLTVNNLSGFNATVRVNASTYEVPAGQTILVPPQPAGLLEYEVFAAPFGVLQPATKRNLNPGNPMTINIFPR